jgi:hypothetical protein
VRRSGAAVALLRRKCDDEMRNDVRGWHVLPRPFLTAAVRENMCFQTMAVVDVEILWLLSMYVQEQAWHALTFRMALLEIEDCGIIKAKTPFFKP